MTFANPTVLEFYRELPFNIQESADQQARAIRDRDSVGAYPPLAKLLRRGARVLEVGCGTGWLSNSMAYHYRAQVSGIDFNPVAVERSRAVAKVLGLETRFEVADLFLFEPAEHFDVVVSIGVLHHTNNCEAAVERVFDRFLAPGGHAFIGLYHEYGRRPFLDYFASMRARGASEDQMFAEYRRMQPQLVDDVQARSWFRDQVLHPHETQHTLAEMLAIMDRCGVELVSTSINRFEPIHSIAELLETEKTYREISLKRLQEGRYFPGFFLVLGRKRA